MQPLAEIDAKALALVAALLLCFVTVILSAISQEYMTLGAPVGNRAEGVVG